jgi:hypothetical protein
MIRDLSVLHAHHIHTFKLDLAVGRSNSEERALMGPVICFKGRHTVAVCKLPVDIGVKIGEGPPPASRLSQSSQTRLRLILSPPVLTVNRRRRSQLFSKYFGNSFRRFGANTLTI